MKLNGAMILSLFVLFFSNISLAQRSRDAQPVHSSPVPQRSIASDISEDDQWNAFMTKCMRTQSINWCNNMYKQIPSEPRDSGSQVISEAPVEATMGTMTYGECLGIADKTTCDNMLGEKGSMESQSSLAEDGIKTGAVQKCKNGESSTGVCLEAAPASSNSTSDNSNPAEKASTSTPDPLVACTEAHKEAMSSCDSDNTSWMENINMVAQGVGPMFQANQGSCGTLAATNVGTSTSIATFAVMCQSAYSKCATTCSARSGAGAASASVTAMANNLKECNAKSAMAKSAQQKAAQATQQIMGAVQACRAQFGNGYDTQAAQYQANYEAQKASDLQVGTSNPGLNSQGTSGGASAGTTGNRNTNIGSLIDGEDISVTPHAIKNSGEDPGGNKGGGHVAMGGGSGGGNAAAGGGGRGNSSGGGLLSNILSGFFGGGGGGMGGSGRGGSSGSGWKSWLGGGDEKKAQAKAPDLRQFLPGGMKDPNRHRGIAGQWIGADGMSGPHANIWQMINNRYQYKRATLLP